MAKVESKSAYSIEPKHTGNIYDSSVGVFPPCGKCKKEKGNKQPGFCQCGRPTTYQPEFCQALIDHYNIDPIIEREIPHYKDGEITWVDIRREANRLPTMRRFAQKIDQPIGTVYSWLDPNHASFQPEFSDTFTRIGKSLLKEFLIENGLNGTHNPAYAKFVAVNMTDMSDRTELTGKDGGAIGIANKTVESLVDSLPPEDKVKLLKGYFGT